MTKVLTLAYSSNYDIQSYYKMNVVIVSAIKYVVG